MKRTCHSTWYVIGFHDMLILYKKLYITYVLTVGWFLNIFPPPKLECIYYTLNSVAHLMLVEVDNKEYRKGASSALSACQHSWESSWMSFISIWAWPTELYQAKMLWLITQPTHLNEEEEASCIRQGFPEKTSQQDVYI